MGSRNLFLTSIPSDSDTSGTKIIFSKSLIEYVRIQWRATTWEHLKYHEGPGSLGEGYRKGTRSWPSINFSFFKLVCLGLALPHKSRGTPLSSYFISWPIPFKPRNHVGVIVKVMIVKLSFCWVPRETRHPM